MRARCTEAEHRLWQRLRGDTLGVRFRRQFVIDRFVADFYCADPPTVVEVDGSAHLGRSVRDAERDRRLTAMGVFVLRVRNEDVLHDLDGVLASIVAGLARAK